MSRLVAMGSARGRARRWNGDHLRVDPDLDLMVVADGGGLTPLEAEAARRCADAVVAHVRGHGAPGAAPEEPRRVLEAAVLAAHEALRSAQEADALSATLVAVQFHGPRATVAHVGNSRVYLLGRRGLCQVTRDHTWVGERVAHGLETSAALRLHPFRGAVTQYLGDDRAPEVEVQELEVLPSERVLLCTDGLWEAVSDFQIWDTCAHVPALQEALDRLLQRAVAQCGEDDATGLLVQGEHTCPGFGPMEDLAPSPINPRLQPDS